MLNIGYLYLLIGLAFLFDFINGFHDAANSIATLVATKVLTPRMAVVWAAFFNFIAFLVFPLTVAATVGTGLVDPSIITPDAIFSALAAAITWNLFTWYFALPSSSSHALIGGLVGSAVTLAGTHVINQVGLTKVAVSIVLSPVLGLTLAFLLLVIVNNLLREFVQLQNNRWVNRVQYISAAFLSLSHGGNDAQKTMGIIAVLLYSEHLLGPTFYVPLWVVISCNFVMALGTLLGGWRIVKTLGQDITALTPVSGSCAEAAAAATIFYATDLGIPISTTHTITGAIAGIGAANGFLKNQWRILSRIVWAWILTLPATALISGGIVLLIQHFRT
jgi:PiT family inorganic phosphate transporter